ncbi:MAG: membrane protein insertion efficiency factor YidD [Oligoflexia bacterium]|nr:membrane protein insertion efficiency factor YidD [Oligoflexia bacterium]
MAIVLIDIYRYVFAGLFGGRCRFTPSCSCYARDAFSAFGFLRGLFLTTKRLSRCHPWGGYGYEPLVTNKAGERDHGTKITL